MGKNISIPRVLYHLTDEKSVSSILNNGLKPRIGQLSKLAEESDKKIYLSDEKSIPYWSLILGKDKMLKIDIDKNVATQIKTYQYPLYCEYTCFQAIDPEYIHEVNVDIHLPKEKLIDLALSFIDSVSAICVLFATYISYKNLRPDYATEHLDTAIHNINIMQYVLPHIDFSVIPQKKLHKHLLLMGDGNYTLCDYYDYQNTQGNTRPRLWQLLGTHLLATKETKWLYEWLIKSQFADELYTETGGWTN